MRLLQPASHCQSRVDRRTLFHDQQWQQGRLESPEAEPANLRGAMLPVRHSKPGGMFAVVAQTARKKLARTRRGLAPLQRSDPGQVRIPDLAHVAAPTQRTWRGASSTSR